MTSVQNINGERFDPTQPDDPLARRFQFWEQSPMPYSRYMVNHMLGLNRVDLADMLDFLEYSDMQRRHDVASGAYIRQRWLEACRPDPLTWVPLQQPPEVVILELRQLAQGVFEVVSGTPGEIGSLRTPPEWQPSAPSN